MFLVHHGIKGQKWGVKHGPPYPIQDHNVSIIRNKSADDANNIYNTLTKKEKQLVTARDNPPEEYSNKKEYDDFLEQNFTLKVLNTPVASLDMWREGDSDIAISIMTRNDRQYRHKGYADRLTKEALKYLQKSDRILNVYWDVRIDNLPSIRLAEKNGFKHEKDFKDGINDGWAQYKKSYKR